MERGLLWLPLLLFFVSFAWIGWREYRKVEAYQGWARSFDQAKYDIYAVIGQKGRLLTWGKPSAGQPTNLQTFSLEDVTDIQLWIDHQRVDATTPPNKGKPSLAFYFAKNNPTVEIPFTEISLAVKWLNYLRSYQGEIQRSQDDFNRNVV